MLKKEIEPEDVFVKTPKGKPELALKVKKYYINRLRGMSKRQAALAAGYKASCINVTTIEATKGYKIMEGGYKGYLLSLEDIARYHNENIIQDKDRGARNNAIRMALEILEVFPKKNEDFQVGNLLITIRKKDDNKNLEQPEIKKIN